jgi:hypothetical protein
MAVASEVRTAPGEHASGEKIEHAERPQLKLRKVNRLSVVAGLIIPLPHVQGVYE